MIIDGDKYKEQLETFYGRYMPCGEPTPYEQGFMDGVKYCIRALNFAPEADTPKQLMFEAFMEE